jgi:uncharacterized protein (DUF302 family)
MNMRLIISIVLLSLLAAPAFSDDGMTVKQSKYSVKETVDRLVIALKERGIAPAARVDHAAGAKSAGMELQPTELLLFGNPRLGTPLIVTNRRSAIDLPMRILVWEDAQKTVWIGYVDPDALKKRYGISGQDGGFNAMKSALEGLATAAGNLRCVWRVRCNERVEGAFTHARLDIVTVGHTCGAEHPAIADKPSLSLK